jgi:hypothetical protein
MLPTLWLSGCAAGALMLLRLASAGATHAGVAYCHGQKYKIGRLVLKLLALGSRVTPEEMFGRIQFL